MNKKNLMDGRNLINQIPTGESIIFSNIYDEEKII